DTQPGPAQENALTSESVKARSYPENCPCDRFHLFVADCCLISGRMTQPGVCLTPRLHADRHRDPMACGLMFHARTQVLKQNKPPNVAFLQQECENT
ncbi:MAG: hypothetical protein ABF931_06025, partial [Acetobacter pasteurianus]